MFLMYVPSKSVVVNGHLLLHLRFLGICVSFFMYTPIFLTMLISEDFDDLCKFDIISNNSEKYWSNWQGYDICTSIFVRIISKFKNVVANIP